MTSSEPNNYSKILHSDRRRDTTFPGRGIIVEAESDRSRLIFSAPFRRLQQKAQVFSLEPNAAVRSRLTHSIEVSQIGRFLSDKISQWLLDTNQITEEQSKAYVTFVEVACLMHDIGNPPFGHFGEAAISQWFKDNGKNLLDKTLDPVALSIPKNVEQVLGDFLEFDGNSQGLRIVSLLQWNNDEYGLNLTYTSLAAYLKYLRPPRGTPFSGSNSKPKFTKKAGFFLQNLRSLRKCGGSLDIAQRDLSARL